MEVLPSALLRCQGLKTVYVQTKACFAVLAHFPFAASSFVQVPIAHPTFFSSRLSHLPFFVLVFVAFPSSLAWKHGYISFTCLKRFSDYL